MDTLLTILGAVLAIVAIGALLLAAVYAAFWLFAAVIAVGLTLLFAVLRVASKALTINKRVELTVRSESNRSDVS